MGGGACRLCLNNVADGETKCPKAHVEAAGVHFESIPIGPANFTDREVDDAVDSLWT